MKRRHDDAGFRSAEDQLRGTMFDPALTRQADPVTSKASAETMRLHLNELQVQVLAAFGDHGRLSPRQLERLPAFATLAPSTARKRCTELVRLGLLRPVGVERELGSTPSTVYEVTNEVSP